MLQKRRRKFRAFFKFPSKKFTINPALWKTALCAMVYVNDIIWILIWVSLSANLRRKKKKVVGWCYKQLHASSTNSFTIHLPSNGQRDDNKREENKGRNKSHKICDNIYALMLDCFHFPHIGAFLFTLGMDTKHEK